MEPEICAVHSMTYEKVTSLEKDVHEITTRVTTVENKIATIFERINWVKAILWLVLASLIGTVINIFMTAAK